MTRLVLRIDFDDERYVGHGRIELLERIDRLGSIAKAAKAMGMSYKRAWTLADSINATFAEPVVERRQGGKGGGAAVLSPAGRELVATYRTMEAKAMAACRKHVTAMEKRLAPPR